VKSILYVSLDEAIAIHDDMVQRYGGSFGIRDLGLLQSAIFRPQSTFGGNDLYPSVIDKAAALFHSLLFNHPFIDGNKRTALTTSARFLYISGYELKAKEKNLVSFTLLAENKHLNIDQISDWLKNNSKKL